MSFEDPFNNAPADAPAEEAQQAPANSVWDNEPKAATPPVVNVGGDGKVVLTYKGGRDFDAPWVVIHATDLDDALRQASQFDKLKELFANVSSGGKYFVGLSGGPSAPANNGGGQQQSRAPRAATEAPSWAPEKPYADFVYRTGVSKKNGSVWHAWMPPQQGDSRKPEFFNAPR